MHNLQPTQGHNPHKKNRNPPQEEGHPTLKSLIQQIPTTGYTAKDSNPGRLLSDDNGQFRGFLGTRRLTYMINIIEDTPREQAWRPRLFEKNQRGEY